MLNKKVTIGELGEQFVAQWLESQGYHILHSRFSCRWGEIDLIAQHPSSNTIAFVEVKTRSQYNWDANGLQAISETKQQKIYQTAQSFIAKYPNLAESYFRFDVASVTYQNNKNGTKFIIKDYLENAFEL